MCQGCVDSGYLSQETYEKINDFVYRYPSSEFGPAHVVLGDDNVDDVNINLCLERTRNELNENPGDVVLQATATFLAELLSVPEDIR